MKKKNVVVTALAVALAAIVALGGGTLAYFTWTSSEIENVTANNYNWVSLMEHDASIDEEIGGSNSGDSVENDSYEIIPGTSQAKNPAVLASYSLVSYVFVEVTDTSDGLINWETADGWEVLTETENADGDVVYGVYYKLLTTDGTPTGTANDISYWITSLDVLKGNSISYDSNITNDDTGITVDEDGVPTVTDASFSLAFQAYIIQADITGDSSYGVTGTTEEAMDCWYALAGETNMGVVAIEGVLYNDVKAGISALDEGETLVLVSDTTVSEGFSGYNYSGTDIPTEYTIDLNGKTLTLEKQAQLTSRSDDQVVDTTLTIENGTVEIAGTSGNIRVEAGTTLTINDVVFTNTYSSSTAQKAIQYNLSDSTATSKMTVENCTFDNTYVDVTGSSGKSYKLNAEFTDCDFSAILSNGSACVHTNAYVYGDITFADCNFEVKVSQNTVSGIYIEALSSNVGTNKVNLTLNNNTFEGTSNKWYSYTYTPTFVRLRDTSVVTVTETKTKDYSYITDGSPVTYNGTAIVVDEETESTE